MKRIVFVCTGNTCRSPMAQALFNAAAVEEKVDAVSESFGIFATDGDRISQNAVKALSEAGIVFSHSAKQISENVIKNADMVFGISHTHAKTLCDMYTEYSDKIYSFPSDIFDPFGSDIEVYRKCRDEISTGIKTIIKYIKENDK